MSTDCKLHKCEICDYKSSKLYNVKRHMVIKHEENAAQNVHFFAQNVHSSSQNVHFPAQNVHFPAQNVHSGNSCDHCSKTFYNNYSLRRHLEKCKGITDRKTCE